MSLKPCKYCGAPARVEGPYDDSSPRSSEQTRVVFVVCSAGCIGEVLDEPICVQGTSDVLINSLRNEARYRATASYSLALPSDEDMVILVGDEWNRKQAANHSCA